MVKKSEHAGKYLLDTSTWIIVLKPNGSEALKNEIRNYLAKDQIVTTPLIVFELLSGVKTKKEYDSLKKELSALQQLQPDSASWSKIYEAGFLLHRQGITVPAIDLIIAMITSYNNCILIHHDYHYKLLASSSVISLQERDLPALPE